MTATAGYLFEGADWEFEKLQRIHDACEEIARSELGLRDLPQPDRGHHRRADAGCIFLGRHELFYKHWSFGKHFAHPECLSRTSLRRPQ